MPTSARSPHTGVVLLGSTGTTVLLLVIALVAIGAAMIALAVWLVRSTRSDPAALGPLEAMAERRYRRADTSGRAAHLDTARPPGAPPPAPIVPLDPPEEPGASAEPGASDEPVASDTFLEPDASDAAAIGEHSEPVSAPPAHNSVPASADAEIGEPGERQPAPAAHDSQPAAPAAAEPVEEAR